MEAPLVFRHPPVRCCPGSAEVMAEVSAQLWWSMVTKEQWMHENGYEEQQVHPCCHICSSRWNWDRLEVMVLVVGVRI